MATRLLHASGRCRFAAGVRPTCLDQRLEAVAVFGEIDRVGRGAEDRNTRGFAAPAASFSGVWPPNCTITPLTLPLVSSYAHDLEHVLCGQRLEIEPVGGVVIGRHRLRIAIDHDGLVTRVGQREGGVAAAIVELDALADAVRAAAENDDLLLSLGRASHSARRRSRSHRSNTYRRSARRIPPRRCRCACRPGARRAPGAARRPRSPSTPASFASRSSEKPMAFSARNCAALGGRPCSRTRVLHVARCPRSGGRTTDRSCTPRRSASRRSRAAAPARP